MDASVPSPRPQDGGPATASTRGGDMPPVEVTAPVRRALPLVLASPHSGDNYTEAFKQASRLDPHALRRSEDSYVHELFAEGPGLGAPLVRATFPRAYLDPNREPYELDPRMFDGELPHRANTRSPRVAAGLGTIARVVANGAEIYQGKLPVEEAEQRLDACYRPYHAALAHEINQTFAAFGYCILVDCHSMPSAAASDGGRDADGGADFVLGDCHGIACAALVVETAQELLEQEGFRVSRNHPYAGGYTTRHYGRPAAGMHALQIEINRRLYMDERSYERLPGLPRLKSVMTQLVKSLGALPAGRLRPR